MMPPPTLTASDHPQGGSSGNERNPGTPTQTPETKNVPGRSGATDGLHPENSSPIHRPSGRPFQPPPVGDPGVRPQDPLEVRPPTVTHRGQRRLAAR
ncbi:hypothetical protein Trydic_g1414 [Trypoxylus dichotomus]